MKYSYLTEVHNLHIFHVVREDKKQYEVGEEICAPFSQKRDFSHWKSYKQQAEELLENERAVNYPEYPSRIDCLFASLNEQSALNWASYKYRKRGVFYLYEMVILEGKLINLDTDFFEEVGLIIANNRSSISGKYSLEECLINYWSGKSFRLEENSMREVLVNGTIKVITKKRCHFDRFNNTILYE